MGPGKSVMVHIEGTRSLSCRTPVQKMSGAFIDMALKIGAPIVPVRFVGGLPTHDLDKRVEFPVGAGPQGEAFANGQGQQDIWLGAPLLPEDLASMPYGDRKTKVIAAINALGPKNADEGPFSGDQAFESGVRSWMEKGGATHEHATLLRILEEGESACPETQLILDGTKGGLQLPDGEAKAWLSELAQRLYGPNGPKVS